VTPAQLVAVRRPCRLAIETLTPRFARPLPSRSGRRSLVLTVNTGYE
jgi:hypothetical protein